MDIQERIKKLLTAENKTQKQLLIEILTIIDEGKITQKKFDSAKGNFSKMMSGKRDFPMNYIVALEKIFKRPFVYLLEGDYSEEIVPFKLRNLEYYAFLNNYERFIELEEYMDDSGHPIIGNQDEFGRGLIDYLLLYRSIEGIRYLAEKHGLKYNIKIQRLSLDDDSKSYLFNQEMTMKLVCLLSEKPKSELFFKIFDPFVWVSLFYGWKNDLIFYNDEFLDTVISSTELLEGILKTKQIRIMEFNPSVRETPYKFDTVKTICPLLTTVLKRMVEKYKKGDSIDSLLRILDFSIRENKGIVDFFVEENKKGQFHGGLNFSDDKNGLILDGWTIIGNMVVYPYPIDPDLPNEIKEKLREIVEQMGRITYLERIQWNGNKTKQYRIIDEKYILTNKTDNKDMYKMYELMNECKDSYLPYYYGEEEGVDKFDYIKGDVKTPSSEDELLKTVDALKTIHKIFSNELDGKIYVHGSFERAVVFSQGEVKGVINWEDCRIGEIAEDLIYLIESYYVMQWNYDNEYDGIFKTIKKVLGRYGERSLSVRFGDKMLKHFEKEKSNLDKTALNYKYLYCHLRMKEAFVELYLNELNEETKEI